MKVINSSTKKIVETKVILCESIWSKARGLMFSTKRSLLFSFNKEQPINLHMIGVFFPIDIILLNKNKKVVQIKRNLKPLQFFHSKVNAKYALELPSKSYSSHLPKLGDTLYW